MLGVAVIDGEAAQRVEGRALGYVCTTIVHADEIERQRLAIRAACVEHGLDLKQFLHDVDTEGRDVRPSLVWALEQLAEHQAEVLVLARLHDLSANPANLRPLLTWFNAEHRRLIALDLQLDTATEAGQLVALAKARAHDGGRSAVADIPELQERIARMRGSGMTLQGIADQLNLEGVPTLRGGALWRPSSVQRATGYRRPSGARGINVR